MHLISQLGKSEVALPYQMSDLAWMCFRMPLVWAPHLSALAGPQIPKPTFGIFPVRLSSTEHFSSVPSPCLPQHFLLKLPSFRQRNVWWDIPLLHRKAPLHFLSNGRKRLTEGIVPLHHSWLSLRPPALRWEGQVGAKPHSLLISIAYENKSQVYRASQVKHG